MKQNIEAGAASIKIELGEGVITVFHGTDGIALFKKKAVAGDWDRIWSAIRKTTR